MEIRRLNPEDVERYAATLDRLLRICTDISFSESVSDSFYSGKLKDMEAYLKLGKAFVFGAFDADELIGFLWAYELQTPEGRKFHISYFAVLPQYTGRGIGSALILEAEQMAREMGIPKTELIVSGNNEDAISFYHAKAYTAERYVMTKSIL